MLVCVLTRLILVLATEADVARPERIPVRTATHRLQLEVLQCREHSDCNAGDAHEQNDERPQLRRAACEDIALFMSLSTGLRQAAAVPGDFIRCCCDANGWLVSADV